MHRLKICATKLSVENLCHQFILIDEKPIFWG